MSERKHKDIVVDKSNEMRTKEISEMISEGGLGAEKYYNIMKIPPRDEEESKMISEGGLGASNYNVQEKTVDNFSTLPSDEKKKE